MKNIAIIPTQLTIQHFKAQGLRIVHRDPKVALQRAKVLARQQAFKPLTA
jgi:hypothetical protein